MNQYCEGKVKRTAGAEWNRTWNRMLTKSQSTFTCDGVPFVEWTGELRLHARLSYKNGAEAKASLNRAIVCSRRPEAVVIYPWSGWSLGDTKWRTEPTPVEKLADELWLAEKFQSNTAIAGSPRNSFRASVEASPMQVEHWIHDGPIPGYWMESNSEWQGDVLGSQTVGDKVHGQEGNSPDHQLRSQNFC